MAQMFPRFLDETTNLGERIVFEELEKMPEDWMVFHNVWEFYDAVETNRHTGEPYRKYENKEADFVVLVPGLGMAVIEVKSYKEVRLEEGVWKYRSAADHSWQSFDRKKCSPLGQAYLAAKTLRENMPKRGVNLPNHFEFTCLAVLVHSAPPEDAEPCERDIYITSPDKKRPGKDHVRSRYIYGMEELKRDLEAKIRGAFVYGNNNLTREIMEQIRMDLCANYFFRRDRASYEYELQTAGAQTGGLLEMLQHSAAHMRVDGCAGSGKTVMLCQEAHRLCDKARREGTPLRILVLCYNEWLYANKFAPEFAGEQDMVTARTFLSFCSEILTPRQIPCGKHKELLPQGADFLTKHFAATTDAERYDYVFIDEAQDFTGEKQGVDWWQVIHELPKHGGFREGRLQPKGRIIAFCDKNQILYGSSDCVPVYPIRLTLNRNLRNPLQVAAYSAKLLPPDERPTPLRLSGEEVCILPASDSVEERRDTVLRQVERILEGDGAMPVEPSDIVVLSPYTKEGLSVVPELNALPEGVRACSIKKFKGLEALYVILADIPAPGRTGFSKNDFYVACTRAKFALYIVPTVEGEPFARAALEQGPDTYVF